MPSWLHPDPRRTRYLGLAVGTIAAGLAIHLTGAGLPPAALDIVGDALWAAMMFWWVSAAAPGASLAVRAGLALAVCFAVETSQLYQRPALDALRRTTPGHLVLGSGFDPRDFVSYTLGAVAAAAIDRVAVYARTRRTISR